jgi:DNA (cytosine-5)-methyltransferase 1
MRPKSGLPKRKALRNMPQFEYGMRDNPAVSNARRDHSDRKSRTRIKVVSLFSGCGGMDLGVLGGFEWLSKYYRIQPFQIVQAYDNDIRAIDTYRLNIDDHVSECDLTNVEMKTLPPCEVLLGGFPCQDFSSCGPKVGFEGKRGKLYLIMVDYLKTHQPELVVAENVPHLAKLRGGELLNIIVKDFEEAGYAMRVWTMFCPDYGLPQNRTRLFFVGVRTDIADKYGRPLAPEPKCFMRHTTINEAIGDLVSIKDESVTNQSQYFVATKATKGAGQGDQVSPTNEISYAVRANPKARVHFHYELPRRLTVRECARLQSFPDEFVFPFSTSTNVLQIGNAVPPIVAHAVAGEIASFFEKIHHRKSANTSA